MTVEIDVHYLNGRQSRKGWTRELWDILYIFGSSRCPFSNNSINRFVTAALVKKNIKKKRSSSHPFPVLHFLSPSLFFLRSFARLPRHADNVGKRDYLYGYCSTGSPSWYETLLGSWKRPVGSEEKARHGTGAKGSSGGDNAEEEEDEEEEGSIQCSSD